ncbi:MAG: hypothetical protein LQ347_004435, partial [Umbilicaria vellea]
MKIPHTITECYQALGLVSEEKELAKGPWNSKMKLCKLFIRDFFENDPGNYIFEELDDLQQFQERATVWVNFYASRLIIREMLQLLAHRAQGRSKT